MGNCCHPVDKKDQNNFTDIDKTKTDEKTDTEKRKNSYVQDPTVDKNIAATKPAERNISAGKMILF